ncbi:MAG: glycosyltransferase family 87 protein [Anaerolineaceae bacterium]
MKNTSRTAFFRGIAIAIIAFGLLMVGFKTLVTSAISFGADFSIYWQAGRALVMHGVSPYDPSTTATIQQGIYGRLAKPGEDQVRYAYPPYSLLVILPTVALTYPWAQAYWMAFNIVLIFAAVIAVKKRPPIWLLAGLIFFYPVSRGIILGQFALMLGAILIVVYGLLHSEQAASTAKQWLAGILLAFCLMKPHFSGLVIIFFLFEVIHKRQWKVIAGFGVGAVFFAGISWILVPTWIADWIRLITDYVGYVPNQPILGIWLDVVGINWSLGWVKILLVFFTVVISTLATFKWWKKGLPDYLFLGWLILISQLLNPNPNSLLSDQIIFFLPLLIWIIKPMARKWVKILTWEGFVIIPWILFGNYLQEKEPYEVASGLALVYFLWLIGTFITHIIDQKNKSSKKELISVNFER